MKVYDQHVHSHHSFDSEEDISKYLDKALELGLEYFVLTDHLDLNYLDRGYDLSFDLKAEDKELSKLQSKYPNIKILRGIEIGYKTNQLNRINKVIKENDFDVINFSLHESDLIDYYYPKPFIERGIKETLKLYFLREYEAVRDFNDFDVFCHLDYGFKSAYLLDNSIRISDYEEDLVKIMKELIKKDKAMEINTKVQSVFPMEHTEYLLKLYKSLGGVHLTLSSDAHELRRFCDGFDKYIPLIKKCGFDHLTYIVKRKKYQIEL